MKRFYKNYLITMKDIVREGHPLLRKKLQEVPVPISEEDKQTLKCMLQYLKNSQDEAIANKHNLRPGSGLSANQIGVNRRMFAVLLENDKGIKQEYMLINPKLISHSAHIIYLPQGEGCLSVDRKVQGHVPRFERIKISAMLPNGEQRILQFKDYDAIVIQHEMDHLDGIMFYDRIDPKRPFMDL